MAKTTIQYIKTLPISDRTQEMVSFIGSNQKLARTLGQINFLIDCRSFNILPNFILNKTAQLSKQGHKQRIANQVSKLQRTFLNEEIKDAFRRKAYLQRCMNRSAYILEANPEEWKWLHSQGKRIFLEELQLVKHRLIKKLSKLCMSQGKTRINQDSSRTHKLGRNFGIDAKEEPNEERPRNEATPQSKHTTSHPTDQESTKPTKPRNEPSGVVNTEDVSESEDIHISAIPKKTTAASTLSIGTPAKKTDHQERNCWKICLLNVWHVLCALFRWVVRAPPASHRHSSLHPSAPTDPCHTSPSTSKGTQVDQEPAEERREPRFVNLSQRQISTHLASILEKGPKFALSQNITSSTLLEVEAGIERAFYGIKWQHVMEKLKSNVTLNRDQQPDRNDESRSPTSSEDNEESSEAASNMPRPFFQDSGARQPPIIPREGEDKLSVIKSKILSLYRGARKHQPSNITPAESKELKALKQDETIIIKRSDKCKNLVVMDKPDYISKAEEIVSSYDVISKNPTTKLEDDTKTLMKTTLQGKIPDDYLRKLLPQHTRTAEFYGLPKTHKAGNPLRPIVSACGDPLDKLSWFVQCILTQILAFIPAHLTNTQTYLTRMKDTFPNGFPPNSIVFSLDVCNLYGSIPIQEGINAVMTILESNLTKINTFSITLEDVRSLLTHVLSNNYVRFNSRIFKQTKGIAMGNRLAPPVAIAFMHAFETSFLSSLVDVPMFYVRYIDDILGVWTHGIDRLNHFFNLMNSHNPAIRLTLDHSLSTGKLAFLDTLITVHPSGSYTTELYFKPMTAPIVLHYTSAHPMSTKKAVLNAEIQRAIRVSSNQQTKERSLSTVTKLFLENGYPHNLIARTIKNNTYKVNVRNRKAKKDINKNTQIFMRLPYINETIVHRVNGILRGQKAPIKPVWINGNSLQKRLISSALISPPCPAGNKTCHTCENGLQGNCIIKNAIYKITCKPCEAQQHDESYVGECTRPVRYRFNEHLSDARLRRLDTPLGEHTLQSHPDLSNAEVNKSFRIEIIDRGKDCADVKIKESIHIRNLKPSLNTMQSSWPLSR